MNLTIDRINDLAENWCLFVWNSCWQSTLLAVVLLLVVMFATRLSVQLRYGILVVALIKFAMPPFMHNATGVFSTITVSNSIAMSEVGHGFSQPSRHWLGPDAKGDLPEEYAGNWQASVDRNTMVAPPPIAGGQAIASNSQASHAVPPANELVRTQESPADFSIASQLESASPIVSRPDSAEADSIFRSQKSQTVSPVFWLTVGHLLISVFLFGHWANQLFRLGRLARQSSRPDSRVCELFQKACKSFGFRRPPTLGISSQIDAPISFGCLFPVITLPEKMNRGDSTCLEIVFAHELAHIKRGDCWVNRLQNLLFVFWWFNPALWVLNWKIRRLREDCCDDVVLSQTEFTGEQYSGSLIKIAKRAKRATGHRAAGLQTAFSIAEHPLKNRIRRIMNPAIRRSSRMSCFGALVVVVLCIVCLPGLRNAIASSETPSLKATENLANQRRSSAGPAEIESALGQPGENQDSGQSNRNHKIRVIDKEGKPIAGATVSCTIRYNKNRKKDAANQPERLSTNDDGLVELAIGSDAETIWIWMMKDSMVTLFMEWTGDDIRSMPESLTVTMQPGTLIGGKVVDSDGNPVQGVSIQAELRNSNDSFDVSDRIRSWDYIPPEEDGSIVTDENGRWAMDRIPAGDITLDFKLAHPDFLPGKLYSFADLGITLKQLREQSASLEISKGIMMSGKVTDDTGRPIEKALVLWTDEHNSLANTNRKTRTDSDGTFSTLPERPGKYYLTVVANGWMPERRLVDATKDSNAEQEFSLRKGKDIRLRFVGRQGQPLAGIKVGIKNWLGTNDRSGTRGPDLRGCNIPNASDENGDYHWGWAPDDGVEFYIYNPKNRALVTRTMVPSKQVREIVVAPPFRFQGKVVNAQTGGPVENYTMTPIVYFSSSDPDEWGRAQSSLELRSSTSEFQDKSNLFASSASPVEVAYRFSAVGYRDFTTGRYRIDSASDPVEIKMVPAEITKATIFDVDGTTATGTRAWLVRPNHGLSVSHYSDYFGQQSAGLAATIADQQGIARFPTPTVNFAVVAVTENGYAEKVLQPGQQVGQLRLQPWASLEGRLFQEGTPVPDALIDANAIRASETGNPSIDDRFQCKTDQNGYFKFEKLPPVPITASGRLGPRQDFPITSSHSVSIDLTPGKDYRINLGGDGVTVTGRVTLGGDTEITIQKLRALNYLVSDKPPIPLPDNVSGSGQYESGVHAEYEKRLWGKAGKKGRDSHFVRLNQDGSFLINGVQPGSWRFLVKLYQNSSGCLVDPVGYRLVEFSVDDSDMQQGKMDLGDIEVELLPVQQPGQTLENFSFQKPEGGSGQLADYRGKYVLLDFWATWCEPCVQSIPDLQELHRTIPNSDKATILSISLDEDATFVRDLVYDRSIAWPQGILGNVQASPAAEILGIGSVPQYIVLDPKGKIVSRTDNLKQACETLFNAVQSQK